MRQRPFGQLRGTHARPGPRARCRAPGAEETVRAAFREHRELLRRGTLALVVAAHARVTREAILDAIHKALGR
jgi:hypothetical protein